METSVGTAVEYGFYKDVAQLVQDELARGTAVDSILHDILNAMERIGRKFEDEKIFVSEMIVSSLAAKRGIEVLEPHLRARNASQNTIRSKVILGTASGDLHDIGKMLLAIAAEAVELDVIDLGVDVSGERFIDAIQANPDCQFVGISAMLSSSIDAIADIIQKIQNAGLRDRVTILVGGAPFSEEAAISIGADIYTADVNTAAQKMRKIADCAQ